jgi:hypothetical protein
LAPGAITSQNRASLFDILEETAEAVRRAGGDSSRFYEIGGFPVRLRFAGPPHLRSLAEALSHLSAPASDDVALSIDVWSGGLDRAARDAIAAASRGGGSVAPEALGWFRSYDRALTAFDRAGNRGYHWLEDPGRDLWFECGQPLRPLLAAWLDRHGVPLIHAGAVGSKEGCVLLVGRSGSGKSHAALVCAEAGLGYLGDDSCLLRSGEPPVVESVYSSAQAAHATLRQLPALAWIASDPARRVRPTRSWVFLSRDLPHAVLLKAPLRAIAIVSRGERRDPRVCPASPAEALASCAPNSLLPVPGVGGGTFEQLAAVVQQVPCVHLESGRDTARVAQAVGELL